MANQTRIIKVGNMPEVLHTGTLDAYHKAVKTIEKQQQVKLTRDELQYGRAASKKSEPLKFKAEELEEAWKIYRQLQENGVDYPSICRHLAERFKLSTYRSRRMVTDARAKYLVKGVK